jgi:predicted RNA-binding Zn-ribbon protein involved in translation (DUF1610 family)
MNTKVTEKRDPDSSSLKKLVDRECPNCGYEIKRRRASMAEVMREYGPD